MFNQDVQSYLNTLSAYLFPSLLGGLGYLLVYYFWEPKRQMDNLKKEIITTLTKYANVRKRSKMNRNNDYSGPGELFEEVELNQSEIEQATQKLRQLTGELRSIINTKKTYSILSYLHLVPQESKIEAVAKCFIGWANSFGQENQGKLIGDYINEVAKILEIPVN